MKYNIIVFKSFEKDFDKLPQDLKERVIDKMELLREDPYSKQSKSSSIGKGGELE